MRLRMHRGHLAWAQVRLSEVFGRPEGRIGHASRFRLPTARRWPNGAAVAFDDDPEGRSLIVVEVPGAALAELSPAEQGDLLRDCLARGATCTRIDVAIDWTGDLEDLIPTMASECGRGVLTGAKRYERRSSMDGRGAIRGDQVRIGARGGDGSGRFVRCYDKGLESKTAPAGRWVRWELEATGPVAAEAAVLIAGTDWRGWDERARAIALGAVDFRERNEGDRHIDRRARCAWWEALIDQREVVRVQAPRNQSSALGWVCWMRSACIPHLVTLSSELGISLEHCIATVIGGGEYREGLLERLPLRQLITAYHAGADPTPENPWPGAAARGPGREPPWLAAVR
jgi:hypothetical protein